MRLSFLCQGHRRWLLDNPGAAASAWFNNHEQAVVLFEEANFKRATAYAGCAMEAADITMDNRPCPSAALVDQYTLTSLLLARLLYRCNEIPVAQVVLGRATARVKTLLNDCANNTSLLQNYGRLLQLGRDIDRAIVPHSTGTAAAGPTLH